MSANTHMNETKPTTTPVHSGLLAGSMVLTMDGYKPVETLTPGTRLITRSGMRALTHMSTTQAMMRPIRIAQGTLGCSRPKQDMLVAPHQEVLVRDWRAEVLFGSEQAIVPVARMVDGTYIKPAETEAMHTAYTLHFASEEVFYADGIEFLASAQVTMDAAADLEFAA